MDRQRDGRIRAVSLVYNLYVAGHENRMLAFAREINRSEFDLRVLVITEEGRTPVLIATSLRPQFAELGIPVDDLGEVEDSNPNPPKLARVLKAAPTVLRIIRKLVRYIREHDIEVIEAHHTTAMFAAVIASRITGVPVMMSSYHVRNWQAWTMRLPGQIALGSAQAIMTDSQARADEIQQWLWRKSVPVHVAPTGVKTPVAQRSPDEVRQRLKLPSDPSLKVIGYVAGLVPSKGQMVLLEAAIEVLKHVSNVVFICVGYSRDYRDYELELRQRIEQAGIADRFLISEYADSIGDVWQVIDIHVHPSLFDSLPLAILEGMASAKPIVATAIGGIPEVIHHERTGLIVPPNDPQAIVQALRRLIDDPVLARRLGNAAREQHQQELTPAVMARKLESVYRQLAGRATASTSEIASIENRAA